MPSPMRVTLARLSRPVSLCMPSSRRWPVAALVVAGEGADALEQLGFALGHLLEGVESQPPG